MTPPCVAVGLVASQYEMVQAMCVLIGHGSFVFWGSFVCYCVNYFTVGVLCVWMDFMGCYLMVDPIDLVYYTCY